jgi:hypothetical protein
MGVYKTLMAIPMTSYQNEKLDTNNRPVYQITLSFPQGIERVTFTFFLPEKDT